MSSRPDPNQTDIHSILQRYWGYSSFRPMQEEIIRSVLDGNDTLGLLPTGGGKSLTFQVPAMALDGLTVVITPLISLMKDQVDNLRAVGIRGVCLHSGMTHAEQRLGFDRCRYGKAKLLYVSPERLQAPLFLDMLRQLSISLIVVDEAHCISQWGYDFRPSYLKIEQLRRAVPSAPVLALTASATSEVVADIQAKLGFRPGHTQVFRRSFARPNISYIVRCDPDKEGRLLRVLTTTSGSAIVYVRSRRRAREIAAMLQENGIAADYYHAGLDPEDKNRRQQLWKDGSTRVIVATNAFGMGIDKPDVRVVAHMDLPPSLEEYYQEAGRAGRDGKPSFAVLICSSYDKGRFTRSIDERFPSKEFLRRVYEQAGNFLNVAVGEGYNQVYEFNTPLFLQTFDLPPVQTRSALGLLTQAGWFEYTDEVATQSRVMLTCTKEELYHINAEPTTEKVLNVLLRSYTGLFADFVHINERSMALNASLTEEQVYKALLALGRMRILQYVPRRVTPYLFYTTSRELPKHVLIPRSVYEEQRQRHIQRIEAVKRFAFSTTGCRASMILEYFGETPQQSCRTCDLCRSGAAAKHPNPEATKTLEESILYMAGNEPRTIDYLVNESSAPRERVVATVRGLVDRGRLDINSEGLISGKHK